MSDMQDNTGQQPRSGPAATPAQAGQAGTARGTAQATAAQADATGRADAGQGYVPRPTPGYDDEGRYEGRHADSTPPSGAALGLTIMAAVLLMVSGLLGFFYGLAAIIKGSFFVVLPNYAFSLSALGWGWVRLVIGAVLFVAGAALFTGHLWARIVGVVVASLAIVAYFVALPYYPVWSVVVIAFSAFAIWALLTPRNPIR
jgi:hypothetical protein